jgi:glutaminase
MHDVLNDLLGRYRDLDDGELASYIPELARVDPALFAISVVTADGRSFDVGDYGVPFTIQSASKPFVYGMALTDHGLDAVMARVGVEPSGDAFNSVVLDDQSNRPFNPMVNAGAIATTDLIAGADLSDRTRRLTEMMGRYCGRDLGIDNAVFMSERATGHRNRAMASLMLANEMVGPDIDQSLDLYFQQCSVLVTSHDLAMMGATLANGGVNPVTGVEALPVEHVKHVLSVIGTCGMYDYAGGWSFRVGLPAKSGVSGGIIAIVPGRLGIGVYSPLLDAHGHSVRGVRVCEELSDRLGLHMMEPHPSDLITELLAPRRLSHNTKVD